MELRFYFSLVGCPRAQSSQPRTEIHSAGSPFKIKGQKKGKESDREKDLDSAFLDLRSFFLCLCEEFLRSEKGLGLRACLEIQAGGEPGVLSLPRL